MLFLMKFVRVDILPHLHSTMLDFQPIMILLVFQSWPSEPQTAKFPFLPALQTPDKLVIGWVC